MTALSVAYITFSLFLISTEEKRCLSKVYGSEMWAALCSCLHLLAVLSGSAAKAEHSQHPDPAKVVSEHQLWSHGFTYQSWPSPQATERACRQSQSVDFSLLTQPLVREIPDSPSSSTLHRTQFESMSNIWCANFHNSVSEVTVRETLETAPHLSTSIAYGVFPVLYVCIYLIENIVIHIVEK